MPSKTPSKPRRVSATGMKTGLEVLLEVKPDDYFATQIPTFGYKVFVHDPYDYADSTAVNMLNEANTLNLLNLDVEMTYATADVRNLRPDLRKCLFSDERPLKYFEHYTFNNCMVECRINISQRLCGCTPFQFDTYKVEKTKLRERACNLRDFPCLLEHQHLLWSSESYINNAEKLEELGIDETNCQCLPDCEYVQFTVEASGANLKRTHAINQKMLYGGIDVGNHTVLKVYENDLVATRNRKDVLFNWHTILAFYGGLLGLFTGCSFVSVIEIIYFFTFRLILNLKNTKKTDPRKTRKNLAAKGFKGNANGFEHDHVIYFK